VSRYGTPALILALCFAIAGTFFFAFRAGRTARHMHWRNEGIEPWMSVPFVAHLHHTRAEPLFEAIHATPGRRDRRSIRLIAREQHRRVGDLLHELEDAIAKANSSGPQSSTPSKAP
jgi:hypothetical protein